MSTELINLLEGPDEPNVIGLDVALDLGLDVEDPDPGGPIETVEIDVVEAARAIEEFAKATEEIPEIAVHVRALLDRPYEEQVAFLLSDHWTFVEGSDTPAQAPGKKCYTQCMEVCRPVCKKICRKVCERRGPKWVCSYVCEVVCAPACKRVCRQVCD